ncbi:MAG TPA: aldehyde dehydrogenase family protein [Myxococcota bacterium]|nr:aldehyde dehydrogenase family protein [Myxococcota bacterium]
MERARRAQARWAALPVEERARRLRPAIDSLLERREQIADIVCEENGKPRVEALLHEIGASVGKLDWLCREAPSILAPEARRLTWMPTRRAEVHRVPHGVVLVISPWNVPLGIPLGQVAAALLAGNAVVLKPSEVTPRCGAVVGELFAGCDLPSGLLQVVQGDGAVGASLIAQKPDKVLFTGSVATGRKVMKAAAEHPIPVGLELGGIDALIVCDDADLEYAASAAAWGATFNGGQVCASVERLLVQASVYEPFLALLQDKLERVDPATELGRITAQRQKRVYEHHLEDMKARGLDIRTGGEFIDELRLAPTLVAGEGVGESAVWREESFGPLVAARPFDTDDQAVQLHDATEFGLTASVFSRNPERARALAGRLRVGLVSINDVGASLYGHAELPWGGVGQSGFGRSQGKEGLLELTYAKVIEDGPAGFEAKRPWWYPYDQDQLQLLSMFGQLIGSRSHLGRARLLARMGGRAARMVTRSPRL